MLFATLMALAVTTAPVGAAEYFVSPAGNDADSGARDAPWRTLEKAGQSAQAGDTVTFLPGSYPGTLAPANDGTAEAPITFRAAERLTARLTADGDNGYAVIISGRAHINIEGFHLAPDPHPGRWMNVVNSRHVTIEDCRMEDAEGGMPFNANGCEQIRLLRSVIHQFRGGNMARFGNCRYVLVEGNSISRATHSPLQFYPDESNQYVVIRGNVFHCNWGRNFEHFSTRDILFEHNIITAAFHGGGSADAMGKCLFDRGIFRFNRVFRNWGGPVNGSPYRISGRDEESLWFRDVRLYNNVFDHNYAFGMMVHSGHPTQVSNIVFANNAFSRNDPHGDQTQLRMTGGEPETVRVLNNLFAGAGPDQPGIIEDHRQGFTVQEAGAEHPGRYAGNIAADPGYLDAEQYNHAPAPGSPMLDAGRPLTSATGEGRGAVLPVEDPWYFYDGFGIVGEVGDVIAVGSPQQRARVVRVDTEARRLVLDREVSWADGDPVSLPWAGDAPDIGIHEQGAGGRGTVQVVAEPFITRPGEAVTFRAAWHGDIQAAHCEWRLGDGTLATGTQVRHAYAEPYDYPVRLTVTDAEGHRHVATGYVVVEAPREPDAPLMHSTFGAADSEWWWRWYHHRPRPRAWEQVLDTRTGEGWLRVYAPDDRGGLTLRANQMDWDVDRYPIVTIRYRIGAGTPVALYLQAFRTAAGARQVCVAASPAATPGEMVTDTVLHDDENWHDLVVDARLIRERYPDVQVLEAVRFGGAPIAQVVKGHWYGVEEVVIGGR